MLAATVTWVISSLPKGSVEFFDGTTLAGTVPLTAAGGATLQVPALVPGTHRFTAVYPGNATSAAAISSPVAVVVRGGPQESALAATPNPVTPSPGTPATTVLTWNAPGAKSVDVRLGSPAGKLIATGGVTGSASVTVNGGEIFYLQDTSNGKPLTLANTLATVRIERPVTRTTPR